jgi:hypothetical protein
METIEVTSQAGLQEFLNQNRAYVNGKNGRVTHLHATVAESRFEIENIQGIYLARPEFAWMAVWMAVTDRTKLRKRHLCYQMPNGADRVGRLMIGGLKEQTEPRDLLCSQAFLYLFEPALLPTRVLDIARESEQDRLTSLVARGYSWQEIERHGRMRRALVPPVNEPPTILELDVWQVAVVQMPQLVPSIEVVLSGDVVKDLASLITFQDKIPGNNYLEK